MPHLVSAGQAFAVQRAGVAEAAQDARLAGQLLGGAPPRDRDHLQSCEVRMWHEVDNTATVVMFLMWVQGLRAACKVEVLSPPLISRRAIEAW